jgi:methionine synthase II (cobalamin-independent)
MKNLDALKLATTEVGSLPLHDDFEGVKINFTKAAVDKVEIGLDYPCYPQLPGTRATPMSMTLQFLFPLARAKHGLEIVQGEVRQTGAITIPRKPIGIQRALFFKELVERRGLAGTVRGFRACVTGPFTLASVIDRKSLLTCGAAKPAVISALTEVIADSCDALVRAGFAIISVDEPFFNNMLGRRVLFDYDADYIIKQLNRVFHRITCFSSIHVCGTITPLTKKVLLTSDVDVVDHEFQTNPRNHGIYTLEELRDNGKVLAYGCVSSTDPVVESVNQIAKSIEHGMMAYGANLLIKPDCGLGGLLGIDSAYAIAIRKLTNLVEASNRVKATLW